MKTGLIMEGGAMRGMFTCGVIDVFMENGGYYAYFPSYIPDGDYSFFISEDFSFGYLGHPWRNEIWIFGEELIKETEKIYKTLGWKKL